MSESCPSSILNDCREPVDWPRFAEMIGEHQRFLLTTHIRPDCDALGSTLAMAAILERLGKDVTIVVGYEVPPNLRFLDPQHKIKQLGVDIARKQLDAADVLMVLDTSAWAQLSHIEEVIRETKAKKVIVDHHESSDDLGAEMFKDPAAEATGRLVVEAADRLGVEITPEMAGLLFVAVATDTGWFHFASTTDETFRIAARLIDAGAAPDVLYRDLYEHETLARLQLIGRVLARARTELDGRLIHTWVELSDFKATGALPTDTEDVINMTLSVGGTDAAVILVELPDGRFKASLRSRCKMNCAKVAEQFGGGGHAAAAGTMLAGPLEAARRAILDAVRRAMG